MNKKTNLLATIVSTTILSLTPTISSAAVFCISDQSDLEDAFKIAKANGENDTLQIVQGTKLNDFELPREIGYLIKLESGYSFNCTERQISPKISLETEKKESAQKQNDVLPQHSTTGPVPPNEIQSKTDTLSTDVASGGTDITVLGVPSYEWRHGCGPTAVGMVLGYWDAKGYDDLFEGSAQTQTEAVDQGIASTGHYNDYSLPKDSYPNLLADKSEASSGDEHTSDSVADFMYTSWSSKNNYYGWSWSNHIIPAFSNYVQLRNSSYVASTATYYFSSTLTWDVLTNEIDSNRPMVFLVDSSGDGYTDHFITIIGYRIQDGYQYYGSYDTWYHTIRWERFRGMSSSYDWGVWGGYSFELSGAVVDETINIVPIINYLLLF